ncbi:hypothetical protein Lspi_0687 [Legionella spiritensis]|uniref:Uncharacterized protein n=1 Tax=Legionella spiritensis TaxID=452 RepID=A0A0W0Z8I2_LEGSP|nr:hypothetical protein Lspi_0687 [Legionella spiritensis]SNV47218.1 Uncharacterised protein [Legionella spiritensis]
MLKKNSGQSPQKNDVLNIAKLSKPQLIQIIAQQLLEGDYRYTSLWCSIITAFYVPNNFLSKMNW